MSIPTVAKKKLSGSTDGRPISVTATASPGTLVHTAVAGTTTGTYDEVWLWAANTSTTPTKLTIEFGGTSASDQIEVTIGAEQGLTLVIPGLPLQNGSVVRAFAATGSVISISGYVNAIVA